MAYTVLGLQYTHMTKIISDSILQLVGGNLVSNSNNTEIIYNFQLNTYMYHVQYSLPANFCLNL